jgi:hypothetical protein
MKRIIALTFLTFFLISLTEVQQLLKLPILVEHFSEHHEKDTKITLWKFLCMHYSSETINDGDFEKDSKLPFKTIDTNSSSNQVIILNELKFCFNTILINSDKKKLIKYYPHFSNSTFSNYIWQPPKFS